MTKEKNIVVKGKNYVFESMDEGMSWMPTLYLNDLIIIVYCPESKNYGVHITTSEQTMDMELVIFDYWYLVVKAFNLDSTDKALIAFKKYVDNAKCKK